MLSLVSRVDNKTTKARRRDDNGYTPKTEQDLANLDIHFVSHKDMGRIGVNY